MGAVLERGQQRSFSSVFSIAPTRHSLRGAMSRMLASCGVNI